MKSHEKECLKCNRKIPSGNYQFAAKIKKKKPTKNTIKTNGNQIQIRCQMFQKIIEFKVDAYTC